MLRSQANWKFIYENQLNEVENLQQLKLSGITQRLLTQRGIVTVDEAKAFLKPELSSLHDPGLLTDIDVAVDRIYKAIEQGENILVFGDYDADGVSSTTVMIEALRELGAICDYYIPNRFTEGYGPNEEAFKEAYKQGFSVIITVDTGIAAIHEADVAKQLGIDLIITDHHEVQEQVPDAFAVVHPKCSQAYPFKELAGVGVAFKLAEKLLGYFPKQLLDLVVIGTIADLVPLVDENRVLAHFGLKAISQSRRPGIKALIQLCNIEGTVTEQDIGFLIGPRINAVGRLQDANPAVDLLLTEDPDEANQLAQLVQEINQERQKIVADIAKEAEAIVENDSSGSNEHVIVVSSVGWNEGVLGIVASKLVRKFDRPAIVLSINPDKQSAKGSARSIPAFDLFSNCMAIREVFTHFGGHAQAAGMTLETDNINILRQKLNEIACEQLTEADYKQEIEISDTIQIDKLDLEMIKEIEKLAPFGMGNPKPIFHLNATPAEIRQIGSQQNHLKLIMKQEETMIDCIGFGMGQVYQLISPKSRIDVVGELQINEWNGKQKPQLMLKDIAVQEWQLFDYRGSRHWHKQLEKSVCEQAIALGKSNSPSSQLVENANFISYDSNVELNDVEFKTLIILEIPDTLEQLAGVLKQLKPENIYACYSLNESHYFNAIPTREDFKWFYALIMKRKQFDIKRETNLLLKHKGWKPEKVNFMTQVFMDLDFVNIKDDKLMLHSNPSKKNLSDSPTYQAKLLEQEKETILYYSTYKELKGWIDSLWNETGLPKEEVVNGL